MLCWDDFLPVADRDALFDHVVRHGRANATVNTVYGGEGSREVRRERRRALGIPDDPTMRALVKARVAAARDDALGAFGLQMFPMGRVEPKATAAPTEIAFAGTATIPIPPTSRGS